MNKLLMALALLISTAAAADPGPLDEMSQKCEKEKTSMFRDNEGTPTCDRLNKIYSDYENRTQVITQDLRQKCDKEQHSLFKDNEGTPSCARLNDVLRDRASFPIGQTFGYSRERGKNCYFTDAGEPSSCP